MQGEGLDAFLDTYMSVFRSTPDAIRDLISGLAQGTVLIPTNKARWIGRQPNLYFPIMFF